MTPQVPLSDGPDLAASSRTRDGVTLSADECARFSHGLADVLCWLAGFEAAHFGREYGGPSMPPGREDLRDLNIKLKTGFE